MKKIWIVWTLCILLFVVPVYAQEKKPTWVVSLVTEISGAPAQIGPDRVVVATRGGDLVCIDAAGKARWQINGKNTFFVGPAVAADGTVYAADAKGVLHEVSPDGKLRREIPLGVEVQCTPLIGAAEVMVIDANFRVTRIERRSGKIMTQKEFKMPALSSAIPLVRGGWAVPVHDFELVGLSPTLEILWKTRVGGVIYSVPAQAADGSIYLTSMDHHLYKLSPEGKILWKFASKRWVSSSPVIDRAGNVYFGSYDHNLYCVGPDGQLRWKYTGVGPVRSTAAIDAAGNIYYGDSSGTIYGLSAAGKLLWKFKSPDFVRSGLTILAPKNLLLVGGIDGTLMAFAVPHTLDAQAQWPKLLGDPRNTGRVGN